MSHALCPEFPGIGSRLSCDPVLDKQMSGWMDGWMGMQRFVSALPSYPHTERIWLIKVPLNSQEPSVTVVIQTNDRIYSVHNLTGIQRWSQYISMSLVAGWSPVFFFFFLTPPIPMLVNAKILFKSPQIIFGNSFLPFLQVQLSLISPPTFPYEKCVVWELFDGK